MENRKSQIFEKNAKEDNEFAFPKPMVTAELKPLNIENADSSSTVSNHTKRTKKPEFDLNSSGGRSKRGVNSIEKLLSNPEEGIRVEFGLDGKGIMYSRQIAANVIEKLREALGLPADEVGHDNLKRFFYDKFHRYTF
jgi:hypothetical protein